MTEEDEQIAKGFDRNIDFNSMKKLLIKEFNKIYNNFSVSMKNIPRTQKNIKKFIYLLIAMIQLRNGSRISEACNALKKFYNMETKSLKDSKIFVKIAKSKSIKYKKDTREKYVTKERFRQMAFPIQWINSDKIEEIFKLINEYGFNDFLEEDRLKKRVLDYLLRNFNCNTHSLRYAFINYMLYDKKKEMSLVAKFVGHVDVAQLVRYTQNKNVEKLFDDEI